MKFVVGVWACGKDETGYNCYRAGKCGKRKEDKHYAEKYKEANDVLKLQNAEKALLQQQSKSKRN